MEIREQECQSKRDQVRSFLIRELHSGKYAPGTIFLSENEVIRTLGVCKNTVREAFSTLVGDGMLERIRGKGTFVREPTLPKVETMTGVVHLIAGDPMKKHQDDPFIGRILQGLHTSLDCFGWKIQLHLISPTISVTDSIREVIASIHPGEWAALAGFNYPVEITDQFRQAGIKVVTIGRPEDPTVPFVENDNVAQTVTAVKYLAACGHRKIAFADRRISHVLSFEERREGYLRGLSECGIVPDARLMVEYYQFDLSAGREIWKKLHTYPVDFTALICYGDWATYGVIQCAALDGVRVPDSFSVISLCKTPVQTADLSIDRIVFPSLERNCGRLIQALSRGETMSENVSKPELIPGNSVRNLVKNLQQPEL